MRKDMDIRFERWADWWAGHIDRSAIGYASMTAEARLTCSPGRTGIPASICPEVMMPPGVAKVDRIVQAMPARWLRLVRAKYVDRRRLTSAQYVEIDRIHNWSHGMWTALNG